MARLGERNLKSFYYATYKDKTDVLDEYGNITGNYEINYNNPVECRARISASKGSTDIALFGTNLNYHKTITIADMDCPIDELTKLWVDETDTDKPHDYVVVSVAKDINYVVYAIRKVNAS